MHKYKRILAIGDIHGEYDKFLNLYGKIGFNPPDDLLVFLGDYIDRGPEPLKVLDWLMERADLVTEMRQVKHYYQKGIEARKGIEN